MFELIFTIIGLVFKGIWGLLKIIFSIFIFLFTAKVLRIFVITGLIVFVPLIVLYGVSPDLSYKVAAHAISTVNTTTFYKYSKDVYLDSIIHGSVRVYNYTTPKEMPYFSAIISRDKLEDTEPQGVLPVNTDIELRSVFPIQSENEDENEKNENLWIEIFFNMEDKPQYAYALLPDADWTKIAQATKPVRTHTQKTVYATVATSGLNVRTGPSSDHGIQDMLHENTRVEVLEKLHTGWVRIKYGDNKTGYVSGDFLSY